MAIQAPQKFGLYTRQAQCPEHHANWFCPLGRARISLKGSRHFAGCLSEEIPWARGRTCVYRVLPDSMSGERR